MFVQHSLPSQPVRWMCPVIKYKGRHKKCAWDFFLARCKNIMYSWVYLGQCNWVQVWFCSMLRSSPAHSSTTPQVKLSKGLGSVVDSVQGVQFWQEYALLFAWRTIGKQKKKMRQDRLKYTGLYLCNKLVLDDCMWTGTGPSFSIFTILQDYKIIYQE